MMRRIFGWIAIGLLVVALAIGGLFWSLTRAPAFYTAEMAKIVPPEVRQTQAREVEKQTDRIVQSVRGGDAFVEDYSQEQINSWLTEMLNGRHRSDLPSQVQDPRLRFQNEEVEIAFRAEDPRTKVSTVVSVLVRPSITPPAKLRIEIVAVRAGLVQLPMDRMLEDLKTRLQKRGWDVVLSRENDRDVLSIDFSSKLIPGAALEKLKISDGSIQVEGHGASKERRSPLPRGQ